MATIRLKYLVGKGEKMNGKKRYIELKGTPAGVKKAKQDLPKARILIIDLDAGRIVITEDKHQLHLKIAKDFNLRIKYIKEVN